MLASSLLAGCTETPPPATANGAATATPSATATATASPTADSSDPWALRGVERLVSDSKRLSALVKTGAAKEFLSRASLLPRVEKRTLFFTADKSKYYTEAQAAALPEDARAALKQQVVDEEEYYNTHYGSPLSYSRPLDILFSRGVTLPAGSKYLDFGYGYIGHLRILASMGVECTGVDVWALLPVLYSFPGDQGAVTGPAGEKGSVRLVDGKFPADPAVVKSVGAGYTLITAKNVLKRGYIHPERPVEHPEKLIKLEVSDEVAIKAFHDALAPGGHFLIYNIAPALTPPDKPFVPWSDGRSPFTKAQFEAAGFEVLEFDKDDLPAVQAMAKGLGWDQPMDGEPGMDIQNDLSALYTLVRKPLAQKK
ncbi:MAG: hypothetical protein R3F14_34205 [Polyangiaceae bacterium]